MIPQSAVGFPQTGACDYMFLKFQELKYEKCFGRELKNERSSHTKEFHWVSPLQQI